MPTRNACRPLPTVLVLLLLAVPATGRAASARGKAEAPDLPAPEKAWADLCQEAPKLLASTRETLLGNKNPGKATWQFQGAKYQMCSDSAASYGQTMARFYFDRILKDKSLTEVGVTVAAVGETARGYREKVAPLLEAAWRLRLALRAVRESLSGKDPAAALAALKDVRFAGDGTDELTHALRKLDAALAAEDVKAAAAWAGEARGAAARLADLLAWAELQTEWFDDLTKVFAAFEPCFSPSDAGMKKQGGRWQNFMFGRCPAANSIQHLCYADAPMIDHLLCDFYTVAEGEMTGDPDADSDVRNVLPSCRAEYLRIREALPAKVRDVLAEAAATDYELSLLGSNLWRYRDEKKVDELIACLQRYAKVQRRPSVTSLMEVLHISQGAWGASTAATDRFHPTVLEYSAKLQRKKDRDAIALAHELAYGFYTWDGKPHYQGRIWTLHDAFRVKAVDCIRISQLIGCIYANAGYSGLHPVRIGRGNYAARAIALSGHTFLDWTDGRRDMCLDGLVLRQD